MTRLFIVSDCGGVGRTTVAANLAHALAARGERVRLRDGDRQQALAVHFGSLEPEPEQRSRAATASLASRSLAPNIDLALDREIDIDIGQPTAGARRSPTHEHTLEIVDTPVAWSADGAVADEPKHPCDGDYVLAVIAPEARCFRTLPALLARHTDPAAGGLVRNFLGLVNAFEPESTLARDTLALVEDALGGRLLPCTVLRDRAIGEAFAGGLPVAEYAPWSQSANAFGQLADTLIAMRAATDAAA